MAPKSKKRTSREISAYNDFKDAGFNVRFSDLNESIKPFELSREAKKYTDPIVKKIKNVDELDDYSLDLLAEQFKTEKQIDDVLDLIKRDQERQLGELTDIFLDAGDEKDASQQVVDNLNKEIKELQEQHRDKGKQLSDASYENTGWAADFTSLQLNLNTLVFNNNNMPPLESFFDGYEKEVGFVMNWRNQEKDPAKIMQKEMMASCMKKCAEFTGPLIEMYKAGSEFCSFRFSEATGGKYENANEAYTKFSNAVRNFLGAVKCGIKKTDNGEEIDKESLASVISDISGVYDILGGDLDIEKIKEANSGFLLFDTGKKLEHQQNIKYIEQNRKACLLVNKFLNYLPHISYARIDGEYIPGRQIKAGYFDPIAEQQSLEKAFKKYKELDEEQFDIQKRLDGKNADLERFTELTLKPDEEKRKNAFNAMNDMYKDMKDFQVNAASFKAKLMKKLDELEQARKYQEELRKAEEVKKNKAQAEAKEKEDRIRQEEARRKEEEDRRRQEEARNAATKVQAVDGDAIDANIYRKELLRLTKELTSKTYHIGQRNSQGFIDLKNALSRMLNPKENYDKKEMVSKNDFIEQMKVLEDACAEYSRNHENRNLNDNQMTRLKIMSRIKNVINMAKDDVDPMSIEGRRRMLVEKYNNAKFIDTLKNSKAAPEDKLAAQNSLLKYDSIGPMAVLEAEKNQAMKALLDKFTVKEMSEDEYFQNVMDQHKDNEIKAKTDAMLKELKKPGARFLKEINNPQKSSEKVL